MVAKSALFVGTLARVNSIGLGRKYQLTELQEPSQFGVDHYSTAARVGVLGALTSQSVTEPML